MSARPLLLIIDDLRQNVEVLGEYLADTYDIQCAFSGSEALVLVTEKAPDLILLDVMMPGMDGYAVCAALKREPVTQDVPVIFVTAKNDAESESRALDAGAVDFIHKPVNPAVLRARVGTHIKLKQHIDELRVWASLDSLTGIANRRTFYERLEAEWRRAMRKRQPLSLLMIDVDFFKHFNDCYGHPEGDICLQKVAELVADTASRAGDLVARYGGEEFVVLLADCATNQAVIVAERICKRLRTLEIPHARSAASDRVTVSIGVAEAWPSHKPDSIAQIASIAETYAMVLHTACELLINAADRAMYAAKQAGRDRIACVTPGCPALPGQEAFLLLNQA